MPRIPEIRDEIATPEQTAVLEADRAAYGDVLNTTRIYAHRPEVVPALQGLHGALAGSSTVPPALVSLARLRVAQINGCPF
jgi:alkylhydroperoxidase family enzyme